MSYNLHTVMPMGNRSKGYEFDTIEESMKGFDRLKTSFFDPAVNKPIPGYEDVHIVLEDAEGNVLREEKTGG